MNIKDYREPEFKVIITAKQDVLTASESGLGLPEVDGNWDTGSGGDGSGGIPLNI